MASPIKLFKPLEEVYQILGIRRSEPKLSKRVSPRCFFLLSSLVIYAASSLAFFILRAKSVAEFGDTFYIASINAASIFLIITYVREVSELRQLTEKFEVHFQESELNFNGF